MTPAAPHAAALWGQRVQQGHAGLRGELVEPHDCLTQPWSPRAWPTPLHSHGPRLFLRRARRWPTPTSADPSSGEAGCPREGQAQTSCTSRPDAASEGSQHSPESPSPISPWRRGGVSIPTAPQPHALTPGTSTGSVAAVGGGQAWPPGEALTSSESPWSLCRSSPALPRACCSSALCKTAPWRQCEAQQGQHLPTRGHPRDVGVTVPSHKFSEQRSIVCWPEKRRCSSVGLWAECRHCPAGRGNTLTRGSRQP